MTRASRRLAGLRAPEVTRLVGSGSIAVLPLGAIEQHGPHLPLETDLVIAERVAEAVVERSGERLDLWLLPALAYTRSNEHAWAPGTMWLSPETLMSTLDELAGSLALTGCERLVLFNGHGGNSALLAVALREIRLRHGLMTFLAHPLMPADRGGDSPEGELGMGVHAGLDETSIMLYLAPEGVDMAEAVRRVPEHLAVNRYVRFGGRVAFGWTSRDFADDGVIGDPTGASAARGAELFEHAVTEFEAALDEIAGFRFR